ncbi:divalent-cation tolerance protein [Tubulinosema ratisbonensis]|uniref:Divalent-cation tolerance protein n=1 Tax=Tubulinosema ratisbonensis TaxID=291195 RepID=A0A437AP63_9MICR|nr:divalent-cation tolerance protein [Tubulinosema ratisbonensis]
MDTKLIIIETTTDDKEMANKLSHLLIKEKLAGCVQVNQINSYYEYDDKINNTVEYLIRIKTLSNYYEDVKEFLSKEHNFELPEFISYECKEVSKDYLDWIVKNLNK